MATVTPGYTFTNDEVVTPAKLNSAATPVVSNIVTADLVDANVTTAKIANGAVTQEKLNSSVTLVPTGAIMPFAMNSAPSGWLAANGSAVSRTAFAALFAAIGTTYGAGDGSTTFTLPDLRGYFVRGAGTNSDTTAAGTFGAKQADGVISHTHGTGVESHSHFHYAVAGVTGSTEPYTSVNINASEYIAARAQSASTSDWSYTLNGVSTVATAGRTSDDVGTHTHTTSSQSPVGTTETRPRNIAMLYCIKA
jgi:microcystin-dependent protein